MAKSSRPSRAKAVPAAETAAANVTAAEPDTSDVQVDTADFIESEPPVPVRWLKMSIGMSGVDISLAPGDKHPFRDVPGPEGEPSEAQRLVDAGYGEFCDAPEA